MYKVLQLTKGESSDELVLGDASLHDETRPVKRRNRVLLSCIPCHELRRKCDRKRPCTRCTDHGVAGQCVYQLEDPALRTGDQDELTRLRLRVAELEHTVRVLTQRHNPDDKGLVPGSLHPQGSAEDGRKPGTSSTNMPGQPQSSRPGALFPGQPGSAHGSSGSGSGLPGSSGHCGCALSSIGLQILGQLLTNLAAALNRLKTLPEHQRRNLDCSLYTQVVHLHQHVRQAIGNNVAQQAVYPGGTPQQSYGLQSPYAPTATSSHSSASPPQTMGGDFLTFSQNEQNFLATPLEPYPYNAPHSSTLPHTLSHSLSHPHLSSGTTSHGQASLPYALGGVLGSSSSNSGYQQYQATAQPSQQYPAALPRAGPSSSVQGSSLSTWNSMTGSSAPQPAPRPSSKSTRHPSTRPAK